MRKRRMAITGWVPRQEKRPDVGTNLWLKSLWLSDRDLIQIFEKSIEARDINFKILYATPDNTGMNWDLRTTMVTLGYEPQDGLRWLIHLPEKADQENRDSIRFWVRWSVLSAGQRASVNPGCWKCLSLPLDSMWQLCYIRMAHGNRFLILTCHTPDSGRGSFTYRDITSEMILRAREMTGGWVVNEKHRLCSYHGCCLGFVGLLT